ncbi:MAG: NADH-quinone oxidoreductase subunit C [bacterium]|nr:NADH-quinone oxidoreductase subunit C [bacterium]
MSDRLEKLRGQLFQDMGKVILTSSIDRGEFTAVVETQSIQRVLLYLRDHPEYRFRQLMDVCGVDCLLRSQKRFEVVYHLLSLKWNGRVRLKVQVDEGESVPTATSIFSCAGWWEREVWDLFGIPFGDHPDLRRILTDYGFEGHPLRKDFPLSGYVEPHYDEKEKEVVYGPVDLPQAYRDFDFLSPWEGMDSVVLPGDEKAEAQKEGEAA